MREHSCLFYVLLGSSILAIYGAPLEISNGNNRTIDEPVAELEHLKEKESSPHPVHLSLSAARSSVFSDVNGRRQGHTETQKQFSKNGELVAKVSEKTDLAHSRDEKPQGKTETEVEIPSEGIRRTAVREEQPEAAMTKMNEISGIEYSPLDMAEYVFWTGDEKGVTLAIEDFLQEGLMNREEAIEFLKSIKTNLDYIQAHYQGLQKMEEKIASKIQQQLKVEENKKDLEENIRTTLMEAMKRKQNAETEEQREEKRKRSDNDDYEDIPDRFKEAEQVYYDYSLEEVIYQLAKLMFSQSLSQGSAHAHQALRRFTEYLEKEVEYGQISRQLEKKILAVMVTALSDTLRERPDLVQAASEGLSGMNDPQHSARNNLMARHHSDTPLQRTKKYGPIMMPAEIRKHVAMRRSIPVQAPRV